MPKITHDRHKETYEPLVGTTNVPRSDARYTVSVGVVGVKGLESEVTRINRE